MSCLCLRDIWSCRKAAARRSQLVQVGVQSEATAAPLPSLLLSFCPMPLAAEEKGVRDESLQEAEVETQSFCSSTVDGVRVAGSKAASALHHSIDKAEDSVKRGSGSSASADEPGEFGQPSSRASEGTSTHVRDFSGFPQSIEVDQQQQFLPTWRPHGPYHTSLRQPDFAPLPPCELALLPAAPSLPSKCQPSYLGIQARALTQMRISVADAPAQPSSTVMVLARTGVTMGFRRLSPSRVRRQAAAS